MIHVILDTNIWLYIANNFLGDFKGEGHVKLFKKLKLYQELGYITLYVNEIIIQEWIRNQAIQIEYIQKLRSKLKTRTELKSLEHIIGNTDALKIVMQEFSTKIDKLIQENEGHINSVDKFITNCRNIPIDESHKLRTVDLAIQNKPPFHQNKNNVNDALIMFSFDSYINNLHLTSFDAAYLVSHNTIDYCEDKNGTHFHPEIKKILSSDILYGNYEKLWKILELSEELQSQLNQEIQVWEENEEENDYLNFECEKCNYDEYAYGELRNPMIIVFASEIMSKYQLTLFEEDEYKLKVNMQKEGFWGICRSCDSKYFICPMCYSYVNFDEDMCPECETSFFLKSNNDSYILFVKDVK